MKRILLALCLAVSGTLVAGCETTDEASSSSVKTQAYKCSKCEKEVMVDATLPAPKHCDIIMTYK